MGQEIEAVHFRHYDFQRFERLLAQELETLHEWFQTRRLSQRQAIGGLELETWLVNADGIPTPINDAVLA